MNAEQMLLLMNVDIIETSSAADTGADGVRHVNDIAIHCVGIMTQLRHVSTDCICEFHSSSNLSPLHSAPRLLVRSFVCRLHQESRHRH